MAPNKTDFLVSQVRRLMNVANDMGLHLESHRSALNSHNSRFGCHPTNLRRMFPASAQITDSCAGWLSCK